MCIKLICSAILLFITGINCEEGVKHYYDYSVIRLIPKTETQLNYLRNLEENVRELDFWRRPSFVNRPVDIMVPPHLNQTFDKIFAKSFFNKITLIDDLEKKINEQRRTPHKKLSKWNTTRADIIANHFDNYQTLENIYHFLDAIQSRYVSLATVVTIGQSYEKRDLQLIRIGENQSLENKPVIFLEAGIHAREWISPATAQCFAQSLGQGFETDDPDMMAMLKKFDFYILPVLNADGYEYTHTNERFWRKTRQPYGLCYGADANRNFDYEWGGLGTSNDPCSDVYRGPGPFSEPETKAVSDYVLSIKSRVKAYLALHSYGQYWLYPWGYTSSVTPDDKNLNRLANVATSALKQLYGTSYMVGTSTNVLYAAAGGSDDWAYGAAGIKYAYTVELRDTGTEGFALSPDQIRPTCAETTLGIIEFAKQLATEV